MSAQTSAPPQGDTRAAEAAVDARPFETEVVWQRVTPALVEELVAFWAAHVAGADPARARLRAGNAVCVGRDHEGGICAVGLAVIRVLPRLRQPMYRYRQFIAPAHRGQAQAVAFANRCRDALEAHNAALPAPEALGLVTELRGRPLPARYAQAIDPATGSIFIGYSPRGFQLRAVYFKDAQLQPPGQPDRVHGGGGQRDPRGVGEAMA